MSDLQLEREARRDAAWQKAHELLVAITEGVRAANPEVGAPKRWPAPSGRESAYLTFAPGVELMIEVKCSRAHSGYTHWGGYTGQVQVTLDKYARKPKRMGGNHPVQAYVAWIVARASQMLQDASRRAEGQRDQDALKRALREAQEPLGVLYGPDDDPQGNGQAYAYVDCADDGKIKLRLPFDRTTVEQAAELVRLARGLGL